MTLGRARLLAIAAAILFSTGGAAIKIDAFTAAQVSSLRSGIAAATLGTWLWLMRRAADAPTRLPRSASVWPTVFAAATYAGMLTLFVAATKLTTAANAIFLQSTAPLYLLVLAPMALRERVRPADFAYAAILGLGLVLCFAGQDAPTATAPNPALGNVLGAASGLVWALTLVSLRWVGRTDQSGAATVVAVIAGNALACAGALPWALPLPAASTAEWATILYLGVFQIGVAYLALTAAVRRLPALDVSLLLLLEPVLNPMWAWLIRGEHPGTSTMMGGIVIVVATAAKIVHGSMSVVDRRP